MADGPAVNKEQIEAIDEVAQDRAARLEQFRATTESIMSAAEHNRAGVRLLDAKAHWYRALSGCASIIAMTGAVAILIEVIR